MRFLFAFAFCFLIASQSSVYAQELTVFPAFAGMEYYEDDQRISRNEFSVLMSKYPETAELWRLSKQNFQIGLGVQIVGSMGSLYWISQQSNVSDSDPQIEPILLLIGSAITSTCFVLISHKQRKNAILTYNRNLDLSYLEFGASQKGVSLSWNF